MHRWGNKKDIVGDDPPYLSVGTEVSAKYKGAFCEAKIRKVVKSVKCKVQYKNEQGSIFVNDEQIKGLLIHGASVEVRQTDKKETIEGTIVKIQDLSQYTVVFDDGDIATLRRTALCLKSGRHFAESETLDQLPLTHPEHFSTPVVSGSRGSRRRDDMEENSEDEEKQSKFEREEDMGKVVYVEIGDKKKSKDNWFPGLVVAPNAQDSVKIDVEEEYLVRSFKDGRYYTVPKSETVEFTHDMNLKVDNPTLKQAVEKAISYMDKSDLPPHWDRDQLFGMTDSLSDIDASDTDSMDDEPREEKDHFVAQLYKFMDDRGTPINKGPVISSKDVDLYKLFKTVYKLGGYNRVTNRNQWKAVAMKLGYNVGQTNNVKSSYKKFLHSFEDFYRKLGCTLLTTSRDNKLRNRSSRPLIRDRDKAVHEKIVEKDENSFSNNEDSLDSKESVFIKDKIDNQSKDVEDIYTKILDIKKEKEEKKLKNRDHSADNNIEKKPDNITKEPSVQMINVKDIKEEKIIPEKRAERKSMKLVTKLEDGEEKKTDRCPLKMTNRRTKAGKKCIQKTERAITKLKEKRGIKEKMKAMVHKLKFKSANASDQDKTKKQKATEELNKLMSHGMRVKLKDELGNNNVKSRKLSVASSDSKSSGSSQCNEKKYSTPSNALNNVTESNSGTSALNNRVKKSDEEGSESSRKKMNSRKRKDEDKLGNVSTESMINQAIEFVPHYKQILIGDKLKVYYEPTHESKVTYEAKVTNKRYGVAIEYLVHYTGWNTRYDEWIRRSRIADNLSWTPSRTKRKVNMPIYTYYHPVTQQIVPLPETAAAAAAPAPAPPLPPPHVPVPHSNGKSERIKRSSTSPVAKNRSKLLKSGMKQMKNLKSRLESKTRKANVQKGSDSGSESENESRQRQELQKTRSRTEKQKQQEEESSGSKESTQTKKKTAQIKRTRSGSIKSETKESVKKPKLSPSVVTKTSKTSTIRNSIMKTFGPKKRAGRNKDSKDEKDNLESSAIPNDADSEEAEGKNDSLKEIKVVSDSEQIEAADESKFTEGQSLLLKIRPLTPEKIVREELEPLETPDNRGKSAICALSTTAVDDKDGATVKKDSANDEEANVLHSQILTDSYLVENLDSKPKIVKAKFKKETDEKVVTPTKNACRSPSEKLTSKSMEIKEKTIFTSRSPFEKKNEKTPEKDAKRISTFSSYLSMDKIDSIKKNSPEKNEKVEKINVAPKVGDASAKSGDDIYEFSEPEPLNIDDRAMLHRRSTPRIFEDSTFKRTKLATTMDSLMKEAEESAGSLEDMNCVETKSIAQTQIESRQQGIEEKCKEKKISEDKSSDIQEKQENSENKDNKTDEELKNKVLESVKSLGNISPMDSQNPEYMYFDEENLGDGFSEKSDDDSKLVILETGAGTDTNDVTTLGSNLVNVDENESEDITCEKVAEKVDVAENFKLTKDNVPTKKSVVDENSSKMSKIKHEISEHIDLEDSALNGPNITRKSKIEKLEESMDGGDSWKNGDVDVVEEAPEEGIRSEIKTNTDDVVKTEEKQKLTTDELFKSKEDENADDGLLLCEETIPKSPEAKENNDMDIEYNGSNRDDETNKQSLSQSTKKKESRSGLFENSIPTSFEGSNSTPETSPSEENSGFSSVTFSMTEKSCMSNKDSSENETSSDTSEKPSEMKKYCNEAYVKKNIYEFDTYLKKKMENEKADGLAKKKPKSGSSSIDGSDKDDESDVCNSPKTEASAIPSTLLPQKPSIANILAEMPLHLDSNQRIEFLEQKMQQIRKKYNAHKQEVASIDRKRKKLRRREREGRVMTRNEANSLL